MYKPLSLIALESYEHKLSNSPAAALEGLRLAAISDVTRNFTRGFFSVLTGASNGASYSLSGNIGTRYKSRIESALLSQDAPVQKPIPVPDGMTKKYIDTTVRLSDIVRDYCVGEFSQALGVALKDTLNALKQSEPDFALAGRILVTFHEKYGSFSQFADSVDAFQKEFFSGHAHVTRVTTDEFESRGLLKVQLNMVRDFEKSFASAVTMKANMPAICGSFAGIQGFLTTHQTDDRAGPLIELVYNIVQLATRVATAYGIVIHDMHAIDSNFAIVLREALDL